MKLNERISAPSVKKGLNKFYCVTVMWDKKYILTKVFKNPKESEDYKDLVSEKSDLTVRCFETTAFPKVKFTNVVNFSLEVTNVAEIIEKFNGILDFTKVEFQMQQSVLESVLEYRLEAANINETIDMLSPTSRCHILLSDFLKVEKLVVCSVWKKGNNKMYRYPQNEEDILITFQITK